MCKTCKTCSQSNFGVTLKKIEERAARMVNGKITEYFEGSEETQEEILINYCFTCGKEIIESDLVEIHICKVCKSKVKQLNENGVCTQCAEAVEKLSEASREDLILMILKQNKKNASKSSGACKPPQENKDEKNNAKLVKNNKKSDTIKRGYKIDYNDYGSKVEIDSKEKVSSKRKRKSNDKINITKKESKDENKEVALISQENMDKAINDNKEKVKSVSKTKGATSKSLNHVIDKKHNPIKDITIGLDVKKDIDIVHNTLMEIEDIMNNISSVN